MQLILTCPNGQELEVNVPGVTAKELVDVSRAHYPPPPAIDRVIINHTFGVQNIVPDVDRYRFRLAHGRIALRPHPACEVSPCSNHYYDMPPEDPNADYSKTIVIVLESPHKDEYLRDVSQPIAPAQGSTGSNIQDYLDCVIRKCPALCDELEGIEARVVLANPVQFQTSLASVVRWSDWHLVRDAVWRDIWNSQLIQEDFEARLESYSPDIIINACTHDAGCKRERCGRNADCKKHKIRAFLAGLSGDLDPYEIAHPFSWHLHRTLYVAANEQ